MMASTSEIASNDQIHEPSIGSGNSETDFAAINNDEEKEERRKAAHKMLGKQGYVYSIVAVITVFL